MMLRSAAPGTPPGRGTLHPGLLRPARRGAPVRGDERVRLGVPGKADRRLPRSLRGTHRRCAAG
ncbi:hypothetical protein K3X38_15115, partial [Listeria monocytogenes]|nr:hypothetical protein [Listeria monocytogenes]